MSKSPYDPVKAKISNRKSYLKNREKRIKSVMKYHWKNREKIIKKMRERNRKKWATDEIWREKQKERLRDLYRRRIAWYKLRSHKLTKSKKHAARQMINGRIRSGTIIRPKNCDACKSNCKPEAHHHKGYNYPLSVIWLCSKCHSELHRKN